MARMVITNRTRARVILVSGDKPYYLSDEQLQEVVGRCEESSIEEISKILDDYAATHEVHWFPNNS